MYKKVILILFILKFISFYFFHQNREFKRTQEIKEKNNESTYKNKWYISSVFSTQKIQLFLSNPILKSRSSLQ